MIAIHLNNLKEVWVMGSKLKAVPASQSISIDITKGVNGFVVSSWDDEGNQTTLIAETMEEANKHAARLLKVGKS
jgi:hypothetical protein